MNLVRVIKACDIFDGNNQFHEGCKDITQEDICKIKSAELEWLDTTVGLHGGEWCSKNGGYNKNIDKTTIIKLAQSLKCRIVVKNGQGQWYLKGNGKTHEDLKEKIKKSVLEKKPRFRNRIIYFIEYCDDV